MTNSQGRASEFFFFGENFKTTYPLFPRAFTPSSVRILKYTTHSFDYQATEVENDDDQTRSTVLTPWSWSSR